MKDPKKPWQEQLLQVTHTWEEVLKNNAQSLPAEVKEERFDL